MRAGKDKQKTRTAICGSVYVCCVTRESKMLVVQHRKSGGVDRNIPLTRGCRDRQGTFLGVPFGLRDTCIDCGGAGDDDRLAVMRDVTLTIHPDLSVGKQKSMRLWQNRADSRSRQGLVPYFQIDCRVQDKS
jgi:hypothetical protein